MATAQEYINSSFSNETQSAEEQGSASTNIPYMLFVYRDQLHRFNKKEFQLFKTKLELTKELVSHSVDHIMEYNMNELMNINREIDFTRKLTKRMDYLRQSQRRSPNQH